MRTLPKPGESAAEVFAVCIARVRNTTSRDKFVAVTQHIVVAADVYDGAATRGQCYALAQEADVGGQVTADDMSRLYKNSMVRKGSAARQIYDRLIAAAPFGRCPLCGQGTVSTLDHYLPKANYPALAVVPYNLVPCCSDCNHAKGGHPPSGERDQLLHPYYDRVDDRRWLEAEIEHQQPAPAVRFIVADVASWSTTTNERIRFHFARLRLDRLYSTYAAQEIVSIRDAMRCLFEQAGPGGLRAHLTAVSNSHSQQYINSWQAALYRALADNEAYCQGRCWDDEDFGKDGGE